VGVRVVQQVEVLEEVLEEAVQRLVVRRAGLLEAE
jgi:hypothetical protein